ncbi:hypothetical protein P886_0189 [Alteromonadaceae bacterium 2753L.S.0a.02]|nr:hypothetical protein P886_1971 [Alteromonadaceae bacterium 2753L.S.0a.02]TVZ40856.1 hypothetical protein P886_0189 [Alteromonadaceae bacterium 2753L.S.0a.02]
MKYIITLYMSLLLTNLAYCAVVQNGYVTSAKYLSLDQQKRQSYLAGYLGGTFVSPMYGADEDRIKSLKSCISKKDIEHLDKIISTYISNNPKTYAEGFHIVAFRVLNKVCLLQ